MPFDNTTPAITCLQTTAGALLAALKITGRVIEGRNAIPVLGCVKFDTDQTLTGSDLDIWVSADIHGVTRPFLAHHKELTKFCTGVDGHELLTATIEQGSFSYKDSVTEEDIYENIITLTCDGMTIVMNTPAVRDLPAPTCSDFGTHGIDLVESEFSLMLKSCMPCISTEATRYYLGGIYFNSPEVAEGQPRKFSMVATDGHRMTEVHTSYESRCGNAIIPLKTVKMLGMMVDAKGTNEVLVRIPSDAIWAKFVGTGWTIISKQIDGTFPDYTRVRAQSQHGQFLAPIKETVKALKRIIGMMDSGSVLIDPAEGTISHKKITAKVAFDLGGGATSFGVNPKYMQDLLGVMSLYGDTVIGFAGESGNPVAFKPQECPAWGDVQITQMPMRY